MENDFKKKGIVLTGHFILSCGKHSNVFVGISEISSNPEFLNNLIKKLVKQIENTKIDLVVAPALSGILFGGLLALHLRKRFIYAERAPTKLIIRRGFDKLIQKGTRVLIADDVITTGKTIKELTLQIESLGGVVVGYATIWQREEIRGMKAHVFSLIERRLESWDKKRCPLCSKGIQISQNSNKHGQTFLKKYGKDPNIWPANKQNHEK